jgi:transposase InsO family protein
LKPKPADFQLRERTKELAAKHPRFGYRRVAALLKQEGFRVNLKKLHRIWRELGLQVPQRRRKWRHSGSKENACDTIKSQCPTDIWAYDFISDQTSDGRPLRILAVVDEFTREPIAVYPARSITAVKMTVILRELFRKHGVPRFIRSDNGPELTAKKLKKHLRLYNVQPLYIEKGAPWQNGFAESFNSRLRDELLDREIFSCVFEARVILENYRKEYIEKRPHSSLGYLTPQQNLENYNQQQTYEKVA